ncbi:MAG: ATP-binding protein [Firmicutes bacterium]|nr:ATP-binding protein [Bacillota bacterium]
MRIDLTTSLNNCYVRPIHPVLTTNLDTYVSLSHNTHGKLYGLILQFSAPDKQKVYSVVEAFKLQSHQVNDVTSLASFVMSKGRHFDNLEATLWSYDEKVNSLTFVTNHPYANVYQLYENRWTESPLTKISSIEHDHVIYQLNGIKANTYILSKEPFKETSLIEASFSDENMTPFDLSEQFFAKHFYPPAIIMSIGKFIETREWVFHGLEAGRKVTENILEMLPKGIDPFEIKLVISELLMNAFFHGNAGIESLPIKIIASVTSEHFYLEVIDTGIKPKEIVIADTLNPDDLLNESGRGLFLVNAVTDKCYVQGNSIIIKKKLIKGEQEVQNGKKLKV